MRIRVNIKKRSYIFILTGICIVFGLSVFGCLQSKHSAAGIQTILKTQIGLASFYSYSLQGRKTASGERYERTEWVAAHPSFPFGTLARVTNLKNNKSIMVRIIDRGPTNTIRSKGVIIDLSKNAAKALGFVREGKARVRVDVLAWGEG